MATTQDVKLFGKWDFSDVEVSHQLLKHTVIFLEGLNMQDSRSYGYPLYHIPCFPVQVTDISLEDYIAVKPKFAVFVPHTAGRWQKKRFRKAQCPIVERYAWGGR